MKNFKKAFGYIIFFLICIGVHFMVLRFGLNSGTDFSLVYIFTGLVCALTLLLIAELNNYFHKYLGFLFIGIIAVKLVAAKVFMDNSLDLSNGQIKFGFIILYLISLVLIKLFTAKLLLHHEK